MAKRKSKGQVKIGQIMREFKEGTLHSGGSNALVKDRRQALAIALEEARRVGGNVKRRPKGSGSFTDAEIAQGYKRC